MRMIDFVECFGYYHQVCRCLLWIGLEADTILQKEPQSKAWFSGFEAEYVCRATPSGYYLSGCGQSIFICF